MSSEELLELTTTGWATGGEAVARGADGRVVFVAGAAADEAVAVELTEARRSFARGRVVEVRRPSPHRIEPVCAAVAQGCGGCDLAFVDAAGQRAAKRAVVGDALARLGGVELDEDRLLDGPDLDRVGFRTTVRGVVVDGRFGFRRRGSHDAVVPASCRVAHPSVQELLVDGRFEGAAEVQVRVGAATGERMVVVDGPREGVSVPADVVVVTTAELAAGRRAWIHEEVADHRFRISADAFFQTRRDGAAALVELVRAAVDGAGTMVDLCSGVGLFAATSGAAKVVAVESNRSAVADARINLAGLGPRARIVRTRFESWRPSAAEVVVADPARAGLGRAGVTALVATGAERVVLVSCDAASLGRDVGLLVESGYRPRDVTLVDLFPDTSHVEAVTVLDRVVP